MVTPHQLTELIQNRRSIFPRDYTGQRVDDDVILQMLENANWAPTHRLTEPWRFVVFSGEGLRRLGHLQAAHYKKTTEADSTFAKEKYESLRSKPLEASHVIAIGMHRDPKNSVPEIEEVGAIFCAIQNMYLTAAACGVGCYFSTGGITYLNNTAALFNFDEFIGFLYVGMPRPGLEPAGRRRPVGEKVRWET